jgi:3-methyladenine DNA glycosylase AlkD
MTTDIKCQEIIAKLKSMSNPRNVEGMARFGIFSKKVLGLSMPGIERMRREIGRDHALAIRLWDSGIYDARILAARVDEPGKVTESQMESWAKGFDNWAVCDNACSKLFSRTAFAHKKALEWSSRESEFVKRAGFSLMAALTVHDKKSGDDAFLKFLPAIKRESADERNYVRKAVNWALRQIGKRNLSLNKAAIKVAKDIQKIDSKSARWIAADALRELRSEAVRKRLG